jgi:hypothetical protein
VRLVTILLRLLHLPPHARYVEEPDPEISRQSAEMRARSRDVVRNAG